MSIAGMINVLHAATQQQLKQRECDTLDSGQAKHIDLGMYGFKVLGAGHFSLVVEHPAMPDIVFKIGAAHRGKPNDGWAMYAGYCMFMHSKYPWMPKISALSIFDDMYIGAMERLDSRWKARDKFGLTYEQNSEDRTTIKHSVEFKECAHALGFYSNDLHEDNVMYRGITPVATDPFAFTTDTSNMKWVSGKSNPLIPLGKTVTIETISEAMKSSERAVVTGSRELAFKRAEENPALRIKPLYERQAQTEGLLRILSPLFREPLQAEEAARELRSFVQRIAGKREGSFHLHVFGLRLFWFDGRCHWTIRPDLVLDSGDRRRLAEAISAWVEQQVSKGSSAAGLERSVVKPVPVFLAEKGGPRIDWPEVPACRAGLHEQAAMAIEKAQPIIAQPEVRRDRDGRRPVGNAHWPVPPIRRLMRNFV